MNSIIDAIEKEQFKSDMANFNVGDGVRADESSTLLREFFAGRRLH